MEPAVPPPMSHSEIARKTTEIEAKRWADERGLKTDEQGWFDELPKGSAPVVEEKIFENVRTNSARKHIRNLNGSIYSSRTMVFVCGGPSASDFLQEIKEKSLNGRHDIFCSNATAKWLIENGVIPNYHVIIDPKPIKVKDLDYENNDVKLILGLQCDPSVFDEAERRGRKTFKFLATSASKDGESDAEIARTACHESDPQILCIGGGSMMGTRAFALCESLGYRRLEMYGFDGSVRVSHDGGVNGYSYYKPRGETILDVEAEDGTRFLSTETFSRQVEELRSILPKMPGLDLHIYGDGFVSHALKIEERKKTKRVSYRISQPYLEMQKKMHEGKGEDSYGTSGKLYAARVFLAAAQLHKRVGSCSILDYGCGPQGLRNAVEASFPVIPGMEFLGYDPATCPDDGKPADLVTCTDVMEHVEPECVENVLDHIESLCKRLVFFSISLTEALKKLPNGRNAHICIRSPGWWLSHLRRRWVIVEVEIQGANLIVVGQSLPKEVH